MFNGEGGEFLVAGAKKARVTSGQKNSYHFKQTDNGLVVNFSNQTGQTVLELDNKFRVLVLDRFMAHKFWVPALTNDPTVPEDKVGELPCSIAGHS